MPLHKSSMRKRIVWILRLALFHSLIVSNLFAGTGTTALNFLQENMSARLVGMGGLSAAVPDDSGSMQTNPAGLAFMQRPEMNLSYLSSNDQSRYAFTAFAIPLKISRSIQMAAGAGLLYYGAGNIDVNSPNGTTQSLNAESDYAGMVSLSARLNRWIAFGITPKYVRSTLVEQYSANATAADGGVLVVPFPSLLRGRVLLGAAFQNLGSQVAYKTVQQNLPLIESLGITGRLFENEEYGSAIASAQGEQSYGEAIGYRFGGEYSFGGSEDEVAFFLRGGYLINLNSQNFSAGVGVREKNFELDYAFTNGVEVENTHRFTIVFKFGKYVQKKNNEKNQLLDIDKESKGETYELIPPQKKEENILLNEKDYQGTSRYDLLKDKTLQKTDPKTK